MPTASAFDLAAEQLERNTPLDRLQARGTLRIAVREAGLDVKTVTARALAGVVSGGLAHELEVRGVERPDSVCTSIRDLLLQTPDA